MGVIHRIFPKMFFPKEDPFQIKDQHNGPYRGTWWYRDRRNKLFGPFWTAGAARDHLESNTIIEPFQDLARGWWWFVDDRGSTHGPFYTIRDADVAIAAYANKDSK